MIWERHISDRLAAYLDGELPAREQQLSTEHLAKCARCRKELDQVRFGMEALQDLPVASAPAQLWFAIESAAARPAPVPNRWPLIASAVAAMLLVVGSAAAYWRLGRAPKTYWEVARLEGAPSVGSKRMDTAGMAATGAWVETDGGSRARIQIGTLGQVVVEANSRVRLLAVRGSEYRLTLASGKIDAKITSPPRLFYVETSAGTAVDLGCEYSLECDRNGAGLLRVRAGWVSYEWQGRESLVPAGASCRTWPGRGPGIPRFNDAPALFAAALDRWESGDTAPSVLQQILQQARVRDTLTLWHLLSRTEGEDRGRVFDRMMALGPLPPGVSRESVLRLDPVALQQWKAELAWTW